MISIKHSSIFDSRAQVLVCPVNCVGVMGALDCDMEVWTHE